MNAFSKAGSAGAVGAITTNVLHEVVRRTVPDAPRVDLLGMQALSKGLGALQLPTPKGRALYRTTLAADLVSNGAYFAFVGARPKSALFTGAMLGMLAGIGAVLLPPRMTLTGETTARTRNTALLSILLYTAGGIAAGLTYDALA